MTSMSEKSLAEIIRGERRTRAWSQEHLAEAAGVNLRTVQRVERGASCAGETIQSLAAALELDAGVLTLAATVVGRGKRWFGLLGTPAVWIGAILCLPGLAFVALNVAYYEMALAVLEPLMLSGAWGVLTDHPLTPAIVLGGPLLAFILNAPHLVRLRARRELDVILVDGLVLHWRATQWMVAGLAFVLIAVMVVYGALENLGHLINGA